MQCDADGVFFNGCQFCLDAQIALPSVRRSVAWRPLGNHVLNHEINIALSLAFDPVTFRFQPHAVRRRVRSKPQ
jgi:hypothetical protein